MAGEFYLGDTGLSPLSDIHTQVAGGLAQLTGAGAPQAADVAASFGNIAFSVNSALDGVSQSRMGTIQTTKTSSDTIAELLGKAQQMYAQGDMASADKLKAAAEALSAQGQGGSSGGGAATGGASGAASGGSPAGAAGGGQAGGDTAGQMVSQIGQQIGQAAQSVTQPLQGLAQGLQQLPQQVMQGVQGIVQAATGAAGGAAGAAGGASLGGPSAAEAKGDHESPRDDEERRDSSPPKDDAAPPSNTQSDDARQGADSAGGRAPVDGSTGGPVGGQPAQTRPQQSPL